MTDADKHEIRERPIRRVVRHKHSREYFTGSGWSKNVDEARLFQDSLEAAHTCAHCGLSGVEMVLQLEGGNSDLYCTELR